MAVATPINWPPERGRRLYQAAPRADGLDAIAERRTVATTTSERGAIPFIPGTGKGLGSSFSRE